MHYLSVWLHVTGMEALKLTMRIRVTTVKLRGSYSKLHKGPLLLCFLTCPCSRLVAAMLSSQGSSHVMDLSPKQELDDYQEILTDALMVPWSSGEVAILEQTAGSVSVLDAVKRNEADVLSGAAAARSAADPNDGSLPAVPCRAPVPRSPSPTLCPSCLSLRPTALHMSIF